MCERREFKLPILCLIRWGNQGKNGKSIVNINMENTFSIVSIESLVILPNIKPKIIIFAFSS